MSTKTFKIGLSATDKQNMAQDIYERLLDLTFAEYDSSETYNTGDFVVYNDVLYQCKEDSVTGTWDSSKWQTATLQDLLDDVEDAVSQVNDKANVDGNYPTMTVGNADQLNSTINVVDKVPYLFRTSGGDADIGNREYDKIIGGSLVVNQLVQNGNFESASGWATDTNYTTISVSNNVLTATITQLGSNYYNTRIQRPIATQTIGHKVLITCKVNPAKTRSMYLCFREGLTFRYVGASDTKSMTANTWNTFTRLITLEFAVDGVAICFNATTSSDFVVNDTIQVKDFQLFDLTQMFGSAIADYIYSLEQANAGAGVDWFRNYFQELYYPYNAGAIKNVKLVSHDMVGFNQWDEEYQLGYWSSSGNFSANRQGYLSSKNPIRVLPNTTYYGKIPASFYVCYFDASMNFIKREQGGQNRNFTTPEKCRYIHFSTYNTYGTTYNNDICINLSWSGWRNGQYEKYQKNPYPLDTNIELRGYPKLDGNNHLYFDGDEYSSVGKKLRRYGTYTFTGNEVWSKSNHAYYSNISGVSSKIKGAPTNTVPNIVCDVLVAKKADRLYTYGDTETGIGTAPNGTIWISELTYQSISSLTGKTIVFELAEPVEEDATPFQEPQIVDDFGTEEYVVPTQDGWQIPVGHDTKYPSNLRDKLQRLPDMPSVSQNVTETYVVNYNGTTKKCTFVGIDTWLDSNGYEKQVDLSDQIIDVAGLTYSVKKAYKVGNVVTLTIVAKNGTGNAIAKNSTLFSLGTLKPSTTLFFDAINYASRTRIMFDAVSGNAQNYDDAISDNEYIYLCITYII